MQIVIDISDEEYKTLSKTSEKEKANELSYYERVIANGIPYKPKAAKRPQGEWLSTTFLGECSLECNQCGKADFGVKYYNFCPNCGARMI